MNRKRICLFLLALATLAYIIGYLYMAWPRDSQLTLGETKILPVTAGKENFILPETRFVETYVNLKSGENITKEKTMPSIYLGMDRNDFLQWIDNYMQNLPINEIEKGLVTFDLESYSIYEVKVKKQYYPDDHYCHYYVTYHNDQIVVYYSDKKTVYDYPEINLLDLPLDMQCQVIEGMPVKDEVELYNFLQNYSS